MSDYLKKRQAIANGTEKKPEKEKKVYRLKRTSIKQKPLAKKSTPDLPLPELLKLAQAVFNKWIRNRGEDMWCFSCGQPYADQAGHFYPAGSYSGVRFHELNVFRQCTVCNEGKHGNFEEYKKRMIIVHGEKVVSELAELAIATKNKSWSREELNHIITKYTL